MSDIWNQEVMLTEEDKQRLGITDAQIAEIEAKKYAQNQHQFWNNVMSIPKQPNNETYSLPNVLSTAYKVYQMSDEKSPLKTDNIVLNYLINKVPLVGQYNRLFDAGKWGAVVQNTYNELQNQ